jgi:hypothetical protein
MSSRFLPFSLFQDFNPILLSSSLITVEDVAMCRFFKTSTRTSDFLRLITYGSVLSSTLLTKNLKIKIYRNIILPFVLYGCETWLLTLQEERKLRVFENMVLRRIFGPRRDEVTGEWWRLHNEELNDLYCSANIVRVIKSRRMRWAGHVARMGEESGVYRVLLGKQEGKRPLGRPRCRWVDNIRMDLQEVGCGYMDWIGLAQVRDRWRTLVSAVMNLPVP